MNAISRVSYDRSIASVSARDGEPDRASITANGIVVDVIANDDGSVYVEAYAAKSGGQVVVAHAAIDAYTVRHPNLKLKLGGS